MCQLGSRGKLPYETVSFSYELEYSTDIVEIPQRRSKKGDRIVILDDLLATGGTVNAITQLCESQGAKIVKWYF